MKNMHRKDGKVGITTKGESIWYEDLTPTWAGVIDALIVLVESGTPESKDFAKHELRRLARIADRHLGNSN
jgi:hypothetical protein